MTTPSQTAGSPAAALARDTAPTLPGHVLEQATGQPFFGIGYAESAADRAVDDLRDVLAQLDAHANAATNDAEAYGARRSADTVENVIRMLVLSSQALAAASAHPEPGGDAS